MTQIIQDIHNSDLFGIFIEMGLGNPVTTKLCEVPGASKTVFYAENPYNDVYSRRIYDIKNRIVSLEAVKTIVNSEKVKELAAHNDKINLVYVSSFQIGNYNDRSTHGFIGIKKHNIETYYHLSIHDSLSRAEYIRLIRDVSINLINDLIADEPDSWNLGINVDGIWDRNLYPMYKDTLYYIGSNSSNFCYIENNNLLRLEDLLRPATEGLIIYKGSFNPITKAHVKLMDEAEKLYPKYKSCYSISLNTWGKEVNMSNLIERINLINELGYGVLIYGPPTFDEIHINIIKKYNKDVIYLMGADTNNRFIEADPRWDLPNRKFIISSRNGCAPNMHPQMMKNSKYIEVNEDISATNIRTAMKLNSQESIIHQIPDELINKLDNFKKTLM